MNNLIIRAVLSITLYFLSNLHTYHIGINQDAPPLHDDLHAILPNLSKHPYIRDIILLLFLIPLIFISTQKRIKIIVECFEVFIIVVTLKAITIFFTFLPPSNEHSHEKRQVNHAYHQIFSGHNSFVFLLVLLYVKHQVFRASIPTFISVFIYALVILMTRCHYTVDVVLSFIIVYLLYDAK